MLTQKKNGKFGEKGKVAGAMNAQFPRLSASENRAQLSDDANVWRTADQHKQSVLAHLCGHFRSALSPWNVRWHIRHSARALRPIIDVERFPSTHPIATAYSFSKRAIFIFYSPLSSFSSQYPRKIGLFRASAAPARIRGELRLRNFLTENRYFEHVSIFWKVAAIQPLNLKKRCWKVDYRNISKNCCLR